MTSTSIQGAGEDGPVTEAPADLMAIFTGYAKDAPESLAYAPNPAPWESGSKQFYVVAPVANGGLGVPRVYYGPADAIQEPTFLAFNPPDSSATATAATSETFDLDGTPTTMPTVVTRETQGLINGFGTGHLTFLCY